MDLSEFTSHIQLFSSFLVALTGALAVVAGIIRPIRNWVLDRISNRKHGEEMQKAIVTLGKSIEDLNTKFDEERAEQALMKNANIATLRNDLTELYYKVEGQGYIGEYDLKNWISMFDVYTSLGGNHYIAELNGRIHNMPGKPRRKRAAKR